MRRNLTTRFREDYEKGRVRCCECRAKVTLKSGPPSATCLSCGQEVCRGCEEKHDGPRGRCQGDGR